MSSTLASRELSQTISPSLLLKKTPPIAFSYLFSRLYSLIFKEVLRSPPVYDLTIAENCFSQSPNTEFKRSLCCSDPCTETLRSIILSKPWTINFVDRSLYLELSETILRKVSFNYSRNCSTILCLAYIFLILCLFTAVDFSLNIQIYYIFALTFSALWSFSYSWSIRSFYSLMMLTLSISASSSALSTICNALCLASVWIASFIFLIRSYIFPIDICFWISIYIN